MAHRSGRGVLESVCAQALKAELAGSHNRRLHTGSILWDLSNDYENLKRCKRKKRAIESGFPDTLVYILMNQYGGPRAVATRTLAMHAGCATKGFPAGCPIATFNMQM